MPALSVPQARDALAAGALLLDLRRPEDFCAEHAAGSICFPFHRQLMVERARRFLPSDQPIVLLMKPEPLAPMAERILREGGLAPLGWLAGGLDAWRAAGGATERLPTVGASQLRERVEAGTARVLDVRDPHEWAAGHIPGAVHCPWPEVWRRASDLPMQVWIVVCNTQVRSAMAASFLLHSGREGIRVGWGGMTAWQEHGYPLEVPTPAGG